MPADIKFGVSENVLSKEQKLRRISPKILPTGKNPYQHFIFRGNPGDKPVELVKLEPFTSNIDEYSRAHIGNYSEGLSKKSFNPSFYDVHPNIKPNSFDNIMNLINNTKLTK